MKISIDISAVTCNDIDFSEFEKLGEVTYFEDLVPEQIYAACKDAEAVIVNKVTVDKKLLDNCKKMKYVGVFATGYNNMDLAELTKRGIVACNVPDYSTDAVAQHTFALLLAFAGKIPEYASSTARGDWIKSKTFCYMTYPTSELKGKTFGVYGYGNIGRAVAKIADAFGMNVIIHTRTAPENCPYKVVSQRDIFTFSDILSLHCPLNESTRGIVNKDTIALMKKSAILINTARGGLVDEGALAEALNSGAIAGACLDSLIDEPMSKNTPLYGAKNVIITPHIAWIPRETRQTLVNTAAANLRAFIEGKPHNQVN